MARVKYTGAVSDLSGSIAGTTFQKNSSGSIARSKATQSFFPSQLQSASRNDFAKVSTYWSKLDLSVQQNWNAYAAAHPIYDRWGNVKTLNGFQYYMQSNINLLGLGLEIIPAPPVFSPQEIVPDYEIVAYSNSLHLDFYPAINYPDCDLVVYASAPTTSSSLLNRKNIWWIGNFPAPNGGIFDIKSFYEQCFNVTWSSFFNSATCNIVFQVILVNRVTGIASPFKGFILSLRNAPEPNWALLGTNFNISPALGASSRSYALTQLFDSSILAFTSSPFAVYKSIDGGLNFSFLSSIAFGSNSRNVACLSNDFIIAAIPSTGCLGLSTDRGLTWSNIGSFMGSDASYSVCVLPDDSVLIGTTPTGIIFKSSSDLSGFVPVLTIGASSIISDIIYLENGILIAVSGTVATCYRSVDFGSSWSLIPHSWPVSLLSSVCYCGNGILLICGGTPGIIFRSIDYGLTWSTVFTDAAYSSLTDIIYFGNGVCFCILPTSRYLLKSTDFGLTWSLFNTLTPASNIWYLLKTASNSFVIGAGSPAFVFKSI